TTIKFTLHKGKTIKEPRYEIPGPPTPEADSQGYYVTTGQGPDLHEASKKAISYMIEHLIDTYGLKDSEAYMLCSISVDLKINKKANFPVKIVAGFVRNKEKYSHLKEKYDVEITEDINRLLESDIDLVVEAANVAAVKENLSKIIKHKDSIVISIGAFSDETF